MYLITNRVIKKGKGLGIFGKTPNPSGPNELRAVNVNKKGTGWSVEHVDNKLTTQEVKRLKDKFHLNIDEQKNWYGSLTVACELFEKAQKERKSILFFAHGYNNDVSDVLKTAYELETLYNVIVVPFTWPANGGGAISGTASYLSDKSDARASSGAFNRFVEKINFFHSLLTEAAITNIKIKVNTKYPDNKNPMAASALYSQLVDKSCVVKINLLCHSMGNYLLKHSLMTSDNSTSKLVFDNICLVAADANNNRHADWVEKLDARKRVYIVINEDDSALKASRIKPGKEQLARLGHYLKKLNSANAIYIDVTDGANSEHSYFKGDSVDKNEKLKAVFNNMFNGLTVEKHLDYVNGNNSYRL
tara:strand:+ start:2476 stop:3558 length:1083 start_codon:yes stop_codon:yes gene_type:complete